MFISCEGDNHTQQSQPNELIIMIKLSVVQQTTNKYHTTVPRLYFNVQVQIDGEISRFRP